MLLQKIVPVVGLLMFALLDRAFANHRVVASVQRELQDKHLYNYNATAIYGFELGASEISAIGLPTSEEIDELLRLTEVYYTRAIGSVYPLVYQSVSLAYETHGWNTVGDEKLLLVNFNAAILFRSVGTIPTEDELLQTLVGLNPDQYIPKFVNLAEPKALFQKVNSADIAADITSSGSPSPTSAPVDTTNPPKDQQFPVTATAPPTPQQTATVIIGNGQNNNGVNPSNNLDQSNPEDDATSDVIVDVDSDTDVVQQQQKGNSQNEKQANSNYPYKETNAASNKETESRVWSTLSDELTAANMFCWVAVVRILYLLAHVFLSKGSLAYQKTEKKIQLASYWIQVVVYTPLLALLTWISLAVHPTANTLHFCETALRTFAHVAMIFLAIYGMELFLRGQTQVDTSLFVHRTILIGAMLYVVGINDSGLQDPLDQVMFGIIELFGALTEHPSLVMMMYYRSWSDSSPARKEERRAQVTCIMWLCTALIIFVKVGLVAVSLGWYFTRLDQISGSHLMWVLPMLRIIQVPTLLRSLYIQWNLTQIVTNYECTLLHTSKDQLSNGPPSMVEVELTGEMEKESSTGETDFDSQSNPEV